MRIAMLIIDMQTIHLQEEPIEQKAIDKACMYINHVSDLLRSKDHIVIHFQDIEGLQESNKEMYEVIPEVQISSNDIKLSKTYSNAFWMTELEQILLNHSVGLVIVSGFAAEHCVLFTYNGAIERGFKTAILQNGILSTKSDAIHSIYRDRSLISYPVIEYITN